MKKMNFKTIFILFYIALNTRLPGQQFHKQVLIDMPGKNYDFELLSLAEGPYGESYITWINENESVYTVFLKKISPEIGENKMIASDNKMKSNPNIDYGQKIKIAWQNNTGYYYQIMTCDYSDDSLNNQTIFRDSLNGDPQISLNSNRIAWIENGYLFLKESVPDTSRAVCIDSSYCSSPCIVKGYARILYMKEDHGSYPMYMADYNFNMTPWLSYQLVSEGMNQNPICGIDDGIAFEHFDGVWKIIYTYFSDIDYLQVTQNQQCNYHNPALYSYAIPTGSSENKTSFFLAFDSDSLENNNEIYIKTFDFAMTDTLINISDMESRDFNPKVVYTSHNDTAYVSIIWIHEEDSESEIWMAKEIFNPIRGAVQDRNIGIPSGYLLQNHPNPFNAVTAISYYLPLNSYIKLSVFDLRGREVAVLVDQEQSPGTYQIHFDAAGLDSGIYTVRLFSNEVAVSRKMLLLK